jgi:branched-chain amino acid transport system substrate-binding protein
MAAKADFVVFFNFGKDTINALKQANNFGLTKKAGSTDPAAVMKALEGMEYDGLTGTEEIQAFDHQVKKNYYLLQAKARKDIKGPGDNAAVISYGKSVKSEAESDCKME